MIPVLAEAAKNSRNVVDGNIMKGKKLPEIMGLSRINETYLT